MNYIQKSKIKALVKKEGFRISPEAFDGINRGVESIIKQMLVKVESDGMKTLMNQHTGVTKTKQEVKKSCNKCANIRPEFLRFARNTQSWCVDEAMVMKKRMR